MNTIMNNKHSIAICGVILLAVTIMFAHYGNAKQGMFLDEIYTYCLSNANIEDFVALPEEDIIIQRETIINALEVQDDEKFAVKSVCYNQSQDVHPPLYYLLVNFVSSIFSDSHSKWIGLGINYVIFVLIICLLFLLSLRIFGTNRAAAIVTSLYAFSLAGMSMLIYIRMYTMLTFFTLLLAYMILGMMRNNDKWYHYCAITVTICLGLLTHYYFVIYAFFVCLSLFIHLINQKEYRRAITFSIASLLGVVLMILIFPPVITQLTSTKLVSGTSAISQLADIKMWFPRIGSNVINIGYFLLFSFVLSAIYCMFLLINRKCFSVDNDMRSIMMVVVVPAFISFILVSIIAPLYEIRYIYNLIPIALLVVPIFDHILESLNIFKVHKIITYSAIACILLNVCFTIIRKPVNLYEEDKTSNLIIQKYSDSKCLFFNSNGWTPFASALQLQFFSEFFLTGETVTEQAIDYICSEDKINLVVFIDIFKNFGKGLNSTLVLDELIQKTQYRRYELLFTNDDFSAAYLLSK